jgi:Ser/Thr protein kinase RdoA (MazF antagonist)
MSPVPAPDPVAVARAFGLGQPVGPAAPLEAGSSAGLFLLNTTDGQFCVKRVRRDLPDWWIASAERGMKFERLALESGIQMPRPVEPHSPLLGYVANVDGQGPVRVYEWIAGRRLTVADDIAEWIGLVLATLHRLQLADSPDNAAYGLHEPRDWEGWFEEASREWPDLAAGGMRSLPLIIDASTFIGEALDRVDDLVVTHRDVEPWNILIGDTGPVLLDWDYAGPDSAWFEASYAAIAYGRVDSPYPDPHRVQAVVRSYLKHGGKRSCSAPWLLAPARWTYAEPACL